jgi:peptidoglycan/LPS O-acetylase OafA/YrhL
MRNESLDGLRGIAVLLVLLHHHSFLNAGWVGVDLFFALSGYLITTIIRRTRRDRFFWREFWIKRATRILPPFLILLFATALLGFGSSAGQTLAYLFSLGDVLAYTRPNFEPLRSLWSLAAEEHFYFVWPFAVRLLPRRTLIFLLCALLVVEPVARGIGIFATRDWQFVYFLSPFRLDGLGLGCLLALAFESPRLRSLLLRWSSSAALLTLGFWVLLRIIFRQDFTRDHPTVLYSSMCYSLIAFIAFCLVAYLLTHPTSTVTALLSLKPLTFTGRISYGLYLYQVIIREVMVARFHLSIRHAFWVDLPLTFVLAWISYVLMEAPLIAWGRRVTERLRVEAYAYSASTS